MTPEVFQAQSVGRAIDVSYVHEDDRQLVIDAIARIDSGEPQTFEYRTVHPNGEIRHILEIEEPSFDDDGVMIENCGTSRDVTDLRRAEVRLCQAQRMEAVDQLTGGIAHDFNNLLTVIQGNVDLIDVDIINARDYVDPVRRAVERGSELTQRLLAFSGQQPLAPKAINLVELISDMTQLLRHTLGENVSVEFEYQAGLWCALADPGQVSDALLNLGHNARDAMPSGGMVTVSCTNIEISDRQADGLDDGDYVKIAVGDTGTGMAESVAAQAFEPFFSTKAVGKGSGLGLSMVYGFAKESRGHASIDSVLGQGTKVNILLPRGPDKAQALPLATQSHTLVKGAGAKILVLEDQQGVQTYLSDLLLLLDYVPLCTSNCAYARQTLDANPDIRVALCDMMLPGGESGADFASDALRDHPLLKVIFMSGNPPTRRILEDDRLSGFTLLEKPFDSKHLSELLSTLSR